MYLIDYSYAYLKIISSCNNLFLKEDADVSIIINLDAVARRFFRIENTVAYSQLMTVLTIPQKFTKRYYETLKYPTIVILLSLRSPNSIHCSYDKNPFNAIDVCDSRNNY